MQVDGPNVTVDAMINLYRTILLPCYLTAALDWPPNRLWLWYVDVSTTTFACIVPQDLPSEKYALYV